MPQEGLQIWHCNPRDLFISKREMTWLALQVVSAQQADWTDWNWDLVSQPWQRQQKKDYEFGTGIVRSLFQTGALRVLKEQVVKYKIDIVVAQETKLLDKRTLFSNASIGCATRISTQSVLIRLPVEDPGLIESTIKLTRTETGS